MADAEDDRDLSITRTVELDALVDDVWQAVTTPELLSGWLEGEVAIDIRPGGTGTIVESDGAVRRVRIDAVEPARRLALRWWPEDGSSPASTVELDLHPMPSGTRLVVTETLLTPARARASAAAFPAARWDLRLVLLGCSLLRVPACR